MTILKHADLIKHNGAEILTAKLSGYYCYNSDVVYSDDKYRWDNTLTEVNTIVDTSHTNLSYAFASCSKLQNVNFQNWNTSNVSSMSNMFVNCTYLIKLENIGTLDVSRLTDTERMFSNCTNLQELDLSGWNKTPNYMMEMFSNCISLASLNLDGWDFENKSMTDIFYNCNKLSYVSVVDCDYSDVNKLIAVLPKGTLANGNKRILHGNETVLHEIEEPDGWKFQYV